ncbi:MAG: tripartite tricarboxylate transporter receptor family protein [Betaproteobacteria bacterium]|nr:tripartite tricarboxylate transporter receptor family protein [Betaproteobacteria bacterium]
MKLVRWLGCGCMMLALSHAQAQNKAGDPYPVKPVRIIVPFPAGGAVDVPARIVAQKMGESSGQPVIVDNIAGAGGTLGNGALIKAPPDGHTFVMTTAGSITITPSLYPQRPYDPVKDFSPVTQLFTLPFILTTNPSLPAKTVPELIALGKSKPGKLNVATSGNGNDYHLAAELFRSMAGIEVTMVPYKGGAPSLTAILAGEADWGFQVISTSLPQIKAGKLNVLGVSSRKRASALPEVPTIAEAGLPGFEAAGWWGVLAPPGTPKDAVEKLREAVVKIIRQPENMEKFSREGFDVVTTTPEQFAQVIRDDSAKWARVVKAAHISVQ